MKKNKAILSDLETLNGSILLNRCDKMCLQIAGQGKGGGEMYQFKKKIFPYMMILPTVLIFGIFIFYPAISGAITSLYNWDGINDPIFIGFANYVKIMKDKIFWESLGRTIIFTAIAVPLVYYVSLGLGLLLVKPLRGKGVFRAVFYWPTMISSIIVGLSWKFLLERDTDYYFRLQMLEGQTVEVRLPVAEGADTKKIAAVEELLGQARFEKEVYCDEAMALTFDESIPFDCQLQYSYTPGVATRLHKREALTGHGTQLLKKGQTKVVLEGLAPQPEFYFFRLEIIQDGITIGCKVGAQVFTKDLLKPASEDLAQRKQAALRLLADTGVDSAYRAAALYALGEDFPLAERIIQDDLEGIVLRKDCSDFYFSVILYLYQQHGQQMSAELRQEIKKTALEFRYWIDEPGNDVMWFFSENHALLFHICQLLAGRLFPNEVFTNSGNSSEKMVSKAERLLDNWFEEFFAEFMTEWNSSAYIPVDMVGLGVLYEAEPEGSALKAKAKKAMDMISRCLAINGHNGANMATFGRSYEEQIKGNYTSGTTSLLYLLYGKGFLNRVGMGYIMLALGSYAPPEEYSRYLTLAPKEQLLFRNTQGFEGHVNTCLYKTSEVVLSTAVAFKPFGEGYQEHIVQAAITPLAQAFINHPGEVQPYGSGRPSFWAGNGSLPLAVQHKGTGVLVYKIADNQLVEYTHAYFPVAEFSQVEIGKNWIAGKQNNGYIGLIAVNGLRLSDKGKFAGRQLISQGKNNIWLVETAQTDEFATLQEFTNYLQQVSVIQTEDEVAIHNSRYGTMKVQMDGTVWVEGQKQDGYPLTAEGILQIQQ